MYDAVQVHWVSTNRMISPQAQPASTTLGANPTQVICSCKWEVISACLNLGTKLFFLNSSENGCVTKSANHDRRVGNQRSQRRSL